jgi:general stress protein 26
MESRDNALQSSEAIEKLKELVNSVQTCMFTTIDEHYQVVSRPMSTSAVDESGDIWFFTNEFSEKVQDVSRDNIVDLIYSHPSKNIYISIKGTCNLIIDRKKMEELWSPELKTWFPEGLQDPKICLIKVVTEEAYYWNHQTSKMGLFFHMIRSAAKGDHYKENEQGKLSLSPNQPES